MWVAVFRWWGGKITCTDVVFVISFVCLRTRRIHMETRSCSQKKFCLTPSSLQWIHHCIVWFSVQTAFIFLPPYTGLTNIPSRMGFLYIHRYFSQREHVQFSCELLWHGKRWQQTFPARHAWTASADGVSYALLIHHCIQIFFFFWTILHASVIYWDDCEECM